MSLSAPFIARPVATTLLAFGIALAGVLAFFQLPVSPLPKVDFPTIAVMANMAGASPETMARSVATPLERYLGQIANVTEMTSSSSTGSTRVILQFGLDRDIDGAARDVQAAINAARADLPTAMRSNPTYRKINPGDAPILILALTSPSLTRGQIYDAASTIVQQKLAQIDGVGQVLLGGSSLPAVRVDLNPHALAQYGIGLESVRAALAATNANAPKGTWESHGTRYQIYANDVAKLASDYRDLPIAWRDGAAVRLRDVADVTDGVEDSRNLGLFNGKPAVPIILFRQPGANIIETVDLIKAAIPALRAAVPPEIDVALAMDPTTTIRASLADVEMTLLLTIALVVFVVYLFLRDARATLIPSVAVPLSLLGTFAVMYMLDYSLDNLSLMALVVSTGFVVDDAIVVVENIARHIENGMDRMKAALRGAAEVGFTVLSMSLSLIAVFIPILLMGGIVGRLFRAFAVTLSVSILVSLVVSLTLTPMMAARLLRSKDQMPQGAGGSRLMRVTLRAYEKSLDWALRHGRLMLLLLCATIGLNVYLYGHVSKGFFPQQDTGRVFGSLQGDQSASFQAMRDKMTAMVDLARQDPAVANVTAMTGSGDSVNTARMFLALKPRGERAVDGGDVPSADAVIARLRKKAASIPGVQLFLQSVQDIRMGGRPGAAQYQYTLQSDDLDALRLWAPRFAEALRARPELADVNNDAQDGGIETDVWVDRDNASRLGLSMSTINAHLYDAFGQRQISTIYKDLNQYHVVMGFAPRYLEDPSALDHLYVSTFGGAISGSDASSPVISAAVRNMRMNQIGGVGRAAASTGSAISLAAETMIPLSSFARIEQGAAPLSVNHQGHFAAATLSFNLRPGVALSEASRIIEDLRAEIGMPANVTGGFQGTAKMFQESMKNQVLLIVMALVAVYIVLGMLYESLIHPLTILSTLPSAGVGALLALMACGMDFSIMALIGIILLIGIVKKNAIMMIDFALDAERSRDASPHDAIRAACLLRFRPIMMTTLAALFGAVPLALGLGEGAELRQPLGLSIVGGLVFSQILTLYTTPVVYLYLDRARHWGLRRMGLETEKGLAR